MKSKKITIAFLWLILLASELVAGAINWPFQMASLFAISTFSFYYLRSEVVWLRLLFLVPPIIYLIPGWFTNQYVLPIKIYPFLPFLIFSWVPIKLKNVWLIVTLLVTTPLIYYGMQIYIDYVSNRNFTYSNHKTFNYTLLDENNVDILNQVTKSDSIIVLECWSVNCGVCITQYPKYKEIVSEFSDQKIAFFNLNLPINGSGQLKWESFTQKYFSPGRNLHTNEIGIWSDLNIDGVPLTIIIYRGEIIRIGHFPPNNKLGLTLRKVIKDILYRE